MNPAPGRHGYTRALLGVICTLTVMLWTAKLSAQLYPSPYNYPPYRMIPGQAPSLPAFDDKVTLPEVSASISDATPYEQQNLIYELTIVSEGNLQTAIVELPAADGLIFKPIGEPVTEKEDGADGAKFITRHIYLLMPLVPGLIDIPPARVHGEGTSQSGRQGVSYEVYSKALPALNVRPANPAVRPWLPLHDLYVDAHIEAPADPLAGDPLKLKVEISAQGATGSQLPSLASQLKSTDVHVYPGRSTTEGSLSEDGKILKGRRVEYYTLVPRYGGWLRLPPVNIDWWNVQQNRREVAALVTNQVNIRGPENPARASRRDSISGPLFWVPLIIGIGIALLGWINAFFGSGRFPGMDWLSKQMERILGDLYKPLAGYAARYSPRPWFHRMRTWTARKLPRSWKLWFCLRSVEQENDPAEWAQALQILSVKHLGTRPHSNLQGLGDTIAAFHPGADRDKISRLMKELDEAVYGQKPIASFQRWKNEFKAQIAPGLIPFSLRRRLTFSRPRLPALNPKTGCKRQVDTG